MCYIMGAAILGDLRLEMRTLLRTLPELATTPGRKLHPACTDSCSCQGCLSGQLAHGCNHVLQAHLAGIRKWVIHVDQIIVCMLSAAKLFSHGGHMHWPVPPGCCMSCNTVPAVALNCGAIQPVYYSHTYT
jgi:hypothetical protein